MAIVPNSAAAAAAAAPSIEVLAPESFQMDSPSGAALLSIVPLKEGSVCCCDDSMPVVGLL